MYKVLYCGDAHKFIEKHKYKCSCNTCNSIFEFSDDDTKVYDGGWLPTRYVKCPVCKNKIDYTEFNLIDTFLVEKPLTLWERIKNFFKTKSKYKLLN